MKVFTNATIYEHPNADAILCENGRIIEIGNSESFEGIPSVDLKGGVVYPGFIDGHMHLLGLGSSRELLNLVGTESIDEIVSLVKQAVDTSPKGMWIMGRGWDQNDWKVKEFPTKETLDELSPDHPVYLRRIDGHASWANSRALELAGIDSATPDTTGGLIVRDNRGNPTGVLIDNAVDLVSFIIPEDDWETKKRQIVKAAAYLNRLGITAIHDAGIELETIHILKELIQEGNLSIRVYAMLEDVKKTYSGFIDEGPYSSDFLNITSVKIYSDGAMGSRGAALLEPYSDDPTNYGLLIEDVLTLTEKVKRYNDSGFQVCIHAIGDRANRLALDIFESVGVKSLRNRIEHAQNIHPDDIERFVDLGVIPAMQPTHCTSDMYWVGERLGSDRLHEAYPWKSLIDAGAVIPGGSDAPIEIPDPKQGIYAAITRQDTTGWPSEGWQPKERVSLDEAINMYTTWAAHGAFLEDVQGKLMPGYYADFTVVSHPFDPQNPKSVLEAEILFTIVNGSMVYKK